jgi:hypothetical protein
VILTVVGIESAEAFGVPLVYLTIKTVLLPIRFVMVDNSVKFRLADKGNIKFRLVNDDLSFRVVGG